LIYNTDLPSGQADSKARRKVIVIPANAGIQDAF